MRLEPTGCWHWFWREEDKRLEPAAVGTRSLGLRRHEEEITSGRCIPAVSIRLGARMTSAWCPSAFGNRSGARITSGLCPRLLTLVHAACVAATRSPPPPQEGARITSGYCIMAVSIRLGERMTSG